MVVEVICSHTPRARVTCDAMARGALTCGETIQWTMEDEYIQPKGDVLVFYGFHGRLVEAYRAYRRDGKPCVYIDLGYWKRVEGGKLYGYHKVSVNSRHPTSYFRNRPKASDRFSRLDVSISPFSKTGSHILIAGMGAKGAAFEGFKANQWEEAALRELRRFTDRPVMYRPKPSWGGALPIEGTTFSFGGFSTIEDALKDCWAVVTHHSNVAVDAICMGIPAFCWHGVAKPMSLQDLSLIETPFYPDNREQWANDIAYCQWRPDEMRTGETWRYLKEEGLV